MRRWLGLVALVLGCWLLPAPGQVAYAGTPTNCQVWPVSEGGSGLCYQWKVPSYSAWLPNLAVACNTHAQNIAAGWEWQVEFLSWTSQSPMMGGKGGCGVRWYPPNGDPSYVTAYGFDSQTVTPVCASGETLEDGECTSSPVECQVLALQSAGIWEWVGTASTFNICEQNRGGTGKHCLVVAEKDIGYQLGGVWHSKGRGTYSGSACTPNPSGDGGSSSTPSTSTGSSPTSTTASKNTCDGYFGQVNGVDVCIPRSSVDVTATPSTPNASTSTTTTDGTTVTNTVNGEQAVSCTPTTCTITTNSTFIQNGQTGNQTTVTTQSRGEFCASNPTSVICTGTSSTAGSSAGSGSGGGDGDGEDSSFSGGCSTSFSCTGDAVQCAVARAVNEQKCIFEKESDEAALYDTVKGATSTGVGTDTVAISSGSFSDANLLAVGGACLPDVVTEVWGTSITVSFSAICPHLETIGQIAFACAFLIAFGIVGRRVA